MFSWSCILIILALLALQELMGQHVFCWMVNLGESIQSIPKGERFKYRGFIDGEVRFLVKFLWPLSLLCASFWVLSQYLHRKQNAY